MSAVLSEPGLDLLFRDARTHVAWSDHPLPDDMPQRLFELAKWGPTSTNSLPARFVFITSQAGKERLKPHLDGGNVDKTMAAPCCVIVAHDREFYTKMDGLMPPPMDKMIQAFFASNPDKAEDNAVRNSTLQGAYLIMAARALGLDCGPMQGFNREGIDGEFFHDEPWTANFLINIGYGDPAQVRPRMKRLAFDDACRIV